MLQVIQLFVLCLMLTLWLSLCRLLLRELQLVHPCLWVERHTQEGP